MDLDASSREAVVWARGQVGSTECPVSYITAESTVWIERFHLWRVSSKPDLMELPSKEGEAIAVLDNEWRKEINETSK